MYWKQKEDVAEKLDFSATEKEINLRVTGLMHQHIDISLKKLALITNAFVGTVIESAGIIPWFKALAQNEEVVSFVCMTGQ